MNKKHPIIGFIGKTNIRKQMNTVYILAVFVPIMLIGMFLIGTTAKLLTNYHRDLLESDNLRVRTILFEITTQAYNISEELSFDEGVADVLTGFYMSEKEFNDIVNKSVVSLDNYAYNYTEIDQIEIYCDNPDIYEYKQYHKVNDEIKNTDWYQKAISQSSVFWKEIKNVDKYNNEYWNLCLIRKIPLVDSDFNAVLVIRLSDNYLKTRINSQEYRICAAVDEGTMFYASERGDYGREQFIDIDYDMNYFQYAGSIKLDAETCFINISTLHLYQSDSRIYISTLNDKSYDNIKKIVQTCLAIIMVAIGVPLVLINVYTKYFTKRVDTLRLVMHQASNEDYDFKEIVHGDDEISQAFADLEIMVQNIKEKDAKMYEAILNKQELANEQQKMEFKMLASQINPHFLYNTLETIRMKAYTAGDKEVATAIKLLGKSMRYVLENNGTASTALKNELDHIEIYMKIQKLRFGDKFDYEFIICDDIDTTKSIILPLLLQPIVENAVLHGLEEKETDGMVTIRVEHAVVENDKTDIRITVSDNGCGMDISTLERLREDIEKKNPEKKASIGLYNINQRVKLCYGRRYGMSIESIPEKGTSIYLLIPEKIQ